MNTSLLSLCVGSPEPDGIQERRFVNVNIIPRGFRRCPFCEESGCNSFVNKYGLYGEASGETGYHTECLEQIFSDPELYGHKLIDVAIDVEQRQEKKKKNEEVKIQQLKENLERVKNRNFSSGGNNA